MVEENDGLEECGNWSATDPVSREQRAPELKPWQIELSEIIGHLGSAIVQSTNSDDRIIMDHVRAAYEIAKVVRRQA